MTLHSAEDKVALEVAGVESGQGETITIASKGGRYGVGAGRLRGGGVHVLEEQVQLGPWNTATLV